jgi:beta-phosphoglucomutase-like phosphatase (HAD superfamily)
VAWVGGHLERLGLRDYFEILMTGDQAARLKPHPELYQRALRSLGLGGAVALALEDSPNGVRAAKGAGLRCVAVPGPMTRELAFDEADLRLGSLAEHDLDDVLARLGLAQAEAPE